MKSRAPGRRRARSDYNHRCLRERSERVSMIVAEQTPTSARVFTAVIFLVRFWIHPKMNTSAHGQAHRIYQSNHLRKHWMLEGLLFLAPPAVRVQALASVRSGAPAVDPGETRLGAASARQVAPAARRQTAPTPACWRAARRAPISLLFASQFQAIRNAPTPGIQRVGGNGCA